MTLSVKQQLQRIRTLRRRIRAARTLLFVLEEGEELSDEQRSSIREGDTVVVLYCPKGYLGDI